MLLSAVGDRATKRVDANDWDCYSIVTIDRRDTPAANPREISSRSANDSWIGDRILGAARIPPALRIIE